MIPFIESGNRIATENFEIGEIYTITFTNGNYKTMCCIGVGSDFVMFQYKLPNALFCLTIGTSDTVSSIEIGGGGSGTMNYNDLENKPQINGITLIGNKTGSELGLVSQSELDNYVTDTELTNELTDYATNASVVAGLATKQDALNSSQLAAVNSGITSTDVAQITTNKTNILSIYNTGFAQKNLLDTQAVTTVKNGITFTVNADKSVTISGTNSVNDTTNLPITNGYVTNIWVGKKLSGCTGGSNTTYALACMYSNDGVSFNKISYQTDGDYTIENFNYIYIIITIYNNYAITDTQTIYPMIRDIGDSTYQPYSMSNAELTAAIQTIQAQLANS